MHERILFDVHPTPGHIQATLKMASVIKNSGHHVVYALPVEYWPIVEKQGFSTTHPVSLLALDEIMRQKNLANPEKDEFAEMRHSLNEIHPHLILIDEHDPYKTILYQILNYPVVFSQSMPDPAKAKGIPPFTSYLLPSGNILNRLLLELLWIRRIVSIWCRLFFKFKTGWTILHRTIAYIARKYGIALFQLIEVDRCFSFGIRGVPRLIISPAAFDFPRPKQKDIFRIGPLVNIAREGKIDHPRINC